MNLPWLQIALELVELSAPDLAVRLEISENEALGGLVRMIGGFIKRCPDHLPPSASAVIPGTGPEPARICAVLGSFSCPPELLISALELGPRPLLEDLRAQNGGIRLRGSERYDPFWGKSHPKLWREWKRNHPKRNGKWPSGGTGPKPGRNRAETASDAGRDRAPVGPQDVDQDQEASGGPPSAKDASLPSPPPPPAARPPLRVVAAAEPGEEEASKSRQEPASQGRLPLMALNAGEGEGAPVDPYLEPAEPPLTGDQFIALWQSSRADWDLPRETLTDRVVAQLTPTLLASLTPGQWGGAMDNYLDPKQSRGSDFPAKKWPLRFLLSPGVLEARTPPAEKRGRVCAVCRARASIERFELPLCAEHEQEWFAAFEAAYPRPELQRERRLAHPELTEMQFELRYSDANRAAFIEHTRLEEERAAKEPELFARWLKQRERGTTAAS